MTTMDAGGSARAPWTFTAARVLLVVQGLGSLLLGVLFLMVAPLVRTRDWAGRLGVLGEIVNALLAMISLVLGVFVAVVPLAVSIFVMVQLLGYAGEAKNLDQDELTG